MARYGQAFKSKTVGRLRAPESAAPEVVAREAGIGVGTLERWQGEVATGSARGRTLSAAARLEAVITTAAMNETGKSAWCREHGVYMAELEQWVASATAALGDPARAAPGARTKPQDGLRIRELERDLRRKDRALSETLALLVLSKKVAAIFNMGEAE